LREWLAALEAEEEPLVPLAWVAAQQVAFDEDDLHGALRRAVLLLAAGGDPHRALALDGRAVTALATDLDDPERRDELADALVTLRLDADGLPVVVTALETLLADPELAWLAMSAGLLAAELAQP
jgi:hypothetical protein